MRTLVYTLDDAHQWAAFSGDYNPVHFDLSRGDGQLTIHGMRALLDVKSALSAQALDASLLKCTVRLRRPLHYGTPYQLTQDSRRAAAMNVTEPVDGQVCLSCQLTALANEEVVAPVSVSTLDADELARLEQAFSPLLSQAQQWQFLDALLFRHLIHDAALLRQEVIATSLPGGATLDAVFSQCQVVQTHQELVFDRRLLASWTPGTFTHPLEIGVLPALVVGDVQSGAVVRIAATICQENIRISNAITLKISQLAPN